MTSKGKIIYLLIGFKGSGKSFIGTLMEEQFNIKFLRVEDWAKDVKMGRQIFDETYLMDVFQAIEAGIRIALVQHSKIVFESTGLTNYFDQMLESLKNEFKVITIEVQADNNLCLNRVMTRDQSIHINVSDDQVKEINKKVQEKNIKTDFYLDNNNKKAEELIIEIGRIVKQNPLTSKLDN